MSNEWQPIETAPINESVLVYVPNAEHYGEPIYRAIKIYFEGRQSQPYWTSTAVHCGRDIAGDYQPSHWMPLPESPLLKPSEKKK